MSDSRNSCVIGGAGFIGTWVTRLLVESGRKVVVIGRHPEPPALFPENAQYVPGDYEDRKVLRAFLPRVDEVIDLAYATVPQTSYADPVFDILSNLPPSVRLLEEAVAAKLRRLIVVSSGGTVYGPVRRLPIGEDSPTEPVSPYGITKLAIEKYALMFHRLYGLPVSIVRPGNAYGAGQRAFTGQGFVPTAMASVLRGKNVVVFGEGKTVRDYVHVTDVASGIIAALDQGSAGEVYNIGTGVGRSNLEVLDAIRPLAESSGLRVNIEFLPSRGFDVSENVLESSKLRSCSGWMPAVSFEKGLSSMWQSVAQVESRGD